MTLLHDDLDEDALRHHVVYMKEHGRCREADELYREWSKENTATSAVTLFHVANCMLLHGLIHDAYDVAALMTQCADFKDHPFMWGDFLADLSMAQMKRGEIALAKNALYQSTKELLRHDADESRLLRNRFFQARITAREGDLSAVYALWCVRQRFLQLIAEKKPFDPTYFRNLSWWLAIFAARFPQAKVEIGDRIVSPFESVARDLSHGLEGDSQQRFKETRLAHRNLLELLRGSHPLMRRWVARGIVSGRIHAS